MGYGRFIWKNGMRHRRRALLTMGSVALAFFALMTLIGFVQEIDRNLEEASPVRLLTRHAVSLTNFLPARHRALIEQVPGVVAVTPLTWFGGIYRDRAQTDFAQFACDPQTFFDVYTDIRIPPEQKQAFQQDRRGILVGRRKAEKHGWKLGDRITLKGVIFPVDLELTVRGIFESTPNQEGSVYFHHAYLEEGVKREWGLEGFAGAYWIRVDSAESAPRVSEAVDALFQNTDAPTKTETEQAFTLIFISMLGNVKLLVATISTVILITLLLVTGNTIAMSVRERTREIAVLKALGFRRSTIVGLLTAEGMLLTFVGGAIGSVWARLTWASMDLAAFSQGFFQQVVISWTTLAAGMVAAILVGGIAAGIPAYLAARKSVLEGLRFVG
ncbi:MAG: ABC transporter permease [Blastocatellia bacterium]|nr:ABC transporter permease [Blastocatellia bacterium]MCS7157815.1 ABC transporter permease [Blastocatellia bacterium]MCX7753328.1 ABC transporter permease [Blastocatellia bacterium]MDW8168109.1 FtsX-like permease family protein [Acidobacteriota bacterium]MDW8257643.1 FtsX-like permease family protein [Acidobacteriota bacterium]